MMHRTDEVITFKADPALSKALKGVSNRSEFIRAAVLAALDGACPLCRGTGILTLHQRRHWLQFAVDHAVEECPDCKNTHLVCIAHIRKNAVTCSALRAVRDFSRVPGALILALGLLIGCSAERRVPASTEPFTVAISVAPQAYLARKIGGAAVRVVTLVAPGENPHTYQPSDSQVSELLRARLFFRAGMPFENGPWMKRLTSAQQMRIVDVRAGIKLRPIEGHAHDEGEARHGGAAEDLDPHIWLAPELLKIQAGTMAEAFAAADPANAGAYRERLAALLMELDALHRELAELLAPCRGKALYLYHPSWGYFCDAYGLRQAPIEIEGKDPSDEELTRFLERARNEGGRVIFVQPQIASRAASIAARALTMRVHTLDDLAEDVPANLRAAARVIAESYR